jgi:predicted transcriptional regulator
VADQLEAAEAPRTVADAMIAAPKISGPEATVRDVKALFENDRVHAVLIAHRGMLLAVVERSDLDRSTSDEASALSVGRLSGRVVAGDHSLQAAQRLMTGSGRRRLGVVDEDGRLVGLLCLKRDGRGFCSSADLQSRADERQSARDTSLRVPTHWSAGLPNLSNTRVD